MQKALDDDASSSGIWDGLVCCVRAAPAASRSDVAETPRHRAELRDVLIRSNDVALAKSVGLATRASGPRGVLSPREREVLDQVRQGRKNAEIASDACSSRRAPSSATWITSSTSLACGRGLPPSRVTRRSRRRAGRRLDRRFVGFGFVLLPLEAELFGTCHAVGLRCAGEHGFERRDDRRIELRLDSLGKAKARDPARHRVAIRPVGGHRVVGVGDRDDPGEQRNLLDR